MNVLDASAILAALWADGPARAVFDEGEQQTLHLADSELLNALRRRVIAGEVTLEQAQAMIGAWSRTGATRYPARALLGRIWELRDNLSGYDAGYVALAEALDCPLVTADARISRAPGIRCLVTVVPR